MLVNVVFVAATVVISSIGEAAKHHGDVFGLYKYDENGYYIQKDTKTENRQFLYQTKDDMWMVGRIPFALKGVLCNRNPSKTVPRSGWEYTGEGWHDDPALSVTPGPLPPLARQFTVTAYGHVSEKCSNCLGVYTDTEKWRNGRPVFENAHGWELSHSGHDVGWEMGNGRCYPLKGSQSHHSPASERRWMYRTLSGDRPASIIVTVTGTV